MAILEEANLLAERARYAKHRTHHVGTKLNEHELHEFEALAERRAGGPHLPLPHFWVPHISAF